MNETTYLADVAARLGLRTYPGQGPWGRKSGTAIGLRDDYVIVVGFSRIKNKAAVTIIVRFRKTEPETLKAAIAQSRALSEKGQGKLTVVGSDFIRWDWMYSYSKPKAERVSLLIDRLYEAIKPVAGRLDSKCEKCASFSVGELILEDGVPVRICAGCQERVRQELNQSAANYDALDPNYVNGLVLGIGAALVGGLVWGLIAYFLHYIFLYGAILIGYFVAWAVIKGTGKITPAGQISIALLTVASVLFGDALFFVLVVMKADATPFSGKLVSAVLTHFWQIETKGNGALSVIFGLIGAGFAVFRARKPQFKVRYEALGNPSNRAV